MSTQTIALENDQVVEVESVGGDLAVEGWDRQEMEARGNPTRIERRPGAVNISTAGELSLKVPRGARLSITTVGGDARLEALDGAIELGMIGGDAQLTNLTGTVRLSGLVGGDTRMENVANISMQPGSAGDRLNMGERLRRKVEQATRRAEAKIRRAEHRAYQHARMADSVRWGFGDVADGSDAAPAGEPVSDEERMKVLQMLQDKKITSEQADQLLTALEGKA